MWLHSETWIFHAKHSTKDFHSLYNVELRICYVFGDCYVFGEVVFFAFLIFFRLFYLNEILNLKDIKMG